MQTNFTSNAAIKPQVTSTHKGYTEISHHTLAGFRVSLRNTTAREPIVALEIKCFKNKRIEICSITGVI